MVCLYHFHNFESVVKIDLKKKREKGKRLIYLPFLFPRTFAYELFKEKYEGKKKQKPDDLKD